MAMDPNDFVSKQLFDAFSETVGRRLKKLEDWQNSSVKEISEISADVKLILQKVDNLITNYGEDSKLIHQRISDTKKDLKNLEEDFNDHANVQPSQDFKNIKTQIAMQVIGYVLLGILGLVLVFK